MTETPEKLTPVGVRTLACAICRRVGLNPDDVKELRITASRMEAVVYKRNRQGRKYLEGDKPAVDRLTFAVTR